VRVRKEKKKKRWACRGWEVFVLGYGFGYLDFGLDAKVPAGLGGKGNPRPTGGARFAQGEKKKKPQGKGKNSKNKGAKKKKKKGGIGGKKAIGRAIKEKKLPSKKTA